MEIEGLIIRLRDPDPRIRVETLRIFAMVEETRALDAIRWVYLHDPEPGVREVAEWAGKLVWQAHQRGHSTEKAVKEMFEPGASAEERLGFIASQLTSEVNTWKHRAVQQFAVDQMFRRRLDEVLRGETPTDDIRQSWEEIAANPSPSLALPEKRPAAHHPLWTDERMLALLDAGLSDEFWDTP